MLVKISATAALLVIVFLVARRPLAQARLKKAAVLPPEGRGCEGPDAVRDRILALGGEDSPVTAVEEANGVITVTWQLHGVPWATQQFQQKLRVTWALDLKVGDGVVQTVIRRGDVSWISPAATWMPRAETRWSTPLRPPLPPGNGTQEPPAVVETTPRDAAFLIETVRHCVVQTGHRFEHVLEFAT